MHWRYRKLKRRAFEAVGSTRHSRPGLNDLDRKLSRYLDFRGGFFIEAGANDGYTQSNTYFLERFLGWHGVLVEPIPKKYRLCVTERPKSQVFQCALVPSDYQEATVEMTDVDLMSLVRGAQKTTKEEAAHVRRAVAVQSLDLPQQLFVPARTLTSILDEVRPTRIDFLSLDVEGFEAAVLDGLDFSRYRPGYILVEARYPDEIDARLSACYERVAKLTHHDVLYRDRRAAPLRGRPPER